MDGGCKRLGGACRRCRQSSTANAATIANRATTVAVKATRRVVGGCARLHGDPFSECSLLGGAGLGGALKPEAQSRSANLRRPARRGARQWRDDCRPGRSRIRRCPIQNRSARSPSTGSSPHPRRTLSTASHPSAPWRITAPPDGPCRWAFCTRLTSARSARRDRRAHVPARLDPDARICGDDSTARQSTFCSWRTDGSSLSRL